MCIRDSYAAYLCLRLGLNQTNMDNRFAFGLWIFLDLKMCIRDSTCPSR